MCECCAGSSSAATSSRRTFGIVGIGLHLFMTMCQEAQDASGVIFLEPSSACKVVRLSKFRQHCPDQVAQRLGVESVNLTVVSVAIKVQPCPIPTPDRQQGL